MIKADTDKLAELKTRGFTTVGGALDLDLVPVLRERLEAMVQEDLEAWKGKPYPDANMVHNPMARDPLFALVLENETMHAFLSPILGETCILYAFTTSSMPPGGSNYSNRIHVDCPRVIPGYPTNLGVIFPLDDFTEDNGATYFLPGSFERETTPSEEEFFAGAVRVFPRAGDMVVFNARTFHLGGQNNSDRARHALTLNVCRSFMRQRFDYPRLVPPEIVAGLGETGRRFLGFNVRMPSSLEEYYLPESERLYKPGQG